MPHEIFIVQGLLHFVDRSYCLKRRVINLKGGGRLDFVAVGERGEGMGQTTSKFVWHHFIFNHLTWSKMHPKLIKNEESQQH